MIDILTAFIVKAQVGRLFSALILTLRALSAGEPIQADQSSDRHRCGASVLFASASSGWGFSQRLEPEPSPDMEWQLSQRADVNAIPVRLSSASSLLASSACFRLWCPPVTGHFRTRRQPRSGPEPTRSEYLWTNFFHSCWQIIRITVLHHPDFFYSFIYVFI